MDLPMWLHLQNERPAKHQTLVVSADLDDESFVAASHESVLSESEQERARSFRFGADRKRFVRARFLLRLLLERYTGIKASTIELESGEHGKPFVRGSRVSFNISHSDNMVMLAFTTGGELGIDVECIEREVEYLDLAERFFCPAEYKKLSSVGRGEVKEAFFNCWTRKEAFIKAVGEGLSYPLDRFEVTLLPDEPVEFIHINGAAPIDDEWFLRSVVPNPGFVGAIAGKGDFGELVCRSWVG